MIPGLTGKEEQAKDKRTLEMLGVRSFDLFSYVIPGRQKQTDGKLSESRHGGWLL